jgi:hypothetical protein
LSPHQPVHCSSPHDPRTGPEHVTAHDGGTDTDVALRHELVVDAGLIGTRPPVPGNADAQTLLLARFGRRA